MSSTVSASPRKGRRAMRSWLLWTLGFVSFPLGGVAGRAVVGPVDDPMAALVGGLVTGVVIGLGQSLASRGRLAVRRWVPATALGLGLGLLVGATSVGFGTSLGELALMGALAGAVLGCTQALALPRGTRSRLVWAVALPALWTLGWTVTTSIGVAVDQQFTVFGAAGAVTVSALLGIVLQLLVPASLTPEDKP